MGLPDDVASTRINRYEKAVRAPDIATAEGIAEQLDIPLPALVARDDRMARMIARFALLSEREQLEVLSDLEHKLGEEAAEKARVQIDGATGPASNPETADKRRF